MMMMMMMMVTMMMLTTIPTITHCKHQLQTHMHAPVFRACEFCHQKQQARLQVDDGCNSKCDDEQIRHTASSQLFDEPTAVFLLRWNEG
jgi:hypothetical protein